MKRKRRNHASFFKANVELAALKGEKTMAELTEQFDVHSNQIQDWRRKLLENAEAIFHLALMPHVDIVNNEQPTHGYCQVEGRSGRLSQ